MGRIRPPGLHQLWLTPLSFGVLLVAMGVLIFSRPELLAYLVAGLFVVVGLVLMGLGWNMRRRVTYRRIDETWPADDEHDRL